MKPQWQRGPCAEITDPETLWATTSGRYRFSIHLLQSGQYCLEIIDDVGGRFLRHAIFPWRLTAIRVAMELRSRQRFPWRWGVRVWFRQAVFKAAVQIARWGALGRR